MVEETYLDDGTTVAGTDQGGDILSTFLTQAGNVASALLAPSKPAPSGSTGAGTTQLQTTKPAGLPAINMTYVYWGVGIVVGIIILKKVL